MCGLAQLQADDFSPHQIQPHGPERLALAPMDLVGPEIAGPMCRAAAIPLGENARRARRALLQLTRWRTAA